MAKRYYICRILGDGTEDNPYYSELRRYIQANWPAEPHFEHQIIHAEVLPWCIMKYDLSDAAHADVMANLTGIFSFGNQALDTTMLGIGITKRNAIRDKLEGLGFDLSWAIATTTVREVLKYLCRSIQLAAWAEVSISAVSRFDFQTTVAEIPSAKRQLIAGKMADLGIDTSWITASHTVANIVQKIQRHSSDGSKRLYGIRKQAQWFFQDEEVQ